MLTQNAAHLGVWDRDLRVNEIVISGEYDKLYGLPTGHRPLTYDEWLNLIHPEDRERVRELMRDTINRTHVWDAEFRVVWPDGSEHWLLGKGTVFLDSSGRPARIIGVNLDITERKQAAAALLESEERFRNMADTAPVMIWVSGPDKLCTFFNKGWLTFTGRTLEQELGNGWASAVHSEDLDRCIAIYSSSFDARRNFQMEYRLRRADGEFRWVLDNGVPRFAPGGSFAGYIGSCIDITDLKRTQEEALARQKLESMGVLAGGIAHDFNNLLGGILAEAELVESDLAAGLPVGEEITRIKGVAIRGAEIVRELMIYAGQDQASLAEPVDLSRLVEELLELLKISISKQVVLQINLDKNLPTILGNASQIRQVLMNLVINASEAIGERVGVIHVATSRVKGRQGSGQYVRLEVSDTGSGMTEEAKAKIFDPFFTTKSAGRGLGLAVVQGIVRDHGGTIDVVSVPGQGATFLALLPCTLKRPLKLSGRSSTGAEQANNKVATILVVEDEELLRVAVSKALRKRGFSVIGASDGTAGMDLMQKHKEEIDVLLLDITLPGRSSREILDEVRRIRPNLKVILTSAYDKSWVDVSFTGLPITHFIRKPFQLSDLVSVLQDALSSEQIN
jgi:PAS domain S-box-containing protein